MKFEIYAQKVLSQKKEEVSFNSFYCHYYLTCKNHLLVFFGDKELTDICYSDIVDYFNGKKQMSKSSLQSQFNTLNTILNHAYFDRLIDRNPCKQYKLNVGVDVKEKQVYTQNEVDLILEYCHIHKDGIGPFLMLKTGINRAELLAIRWNDISFKEQTISICHNAIDEFGINESNITTRKKRLAPTKNKFRNRTIAIDSDTVLFLAQRYEGQKIKTSDGVICKSEFVVSNIHGEMQSPSNWQRRRYSQFMQDMHEYYLAKGIDIPIYTPHSLRHTRASLWLNNGISPVAIAHQLGWSDFTMLNKVYGHRDISVLRQQLEY